MPLPMLSGTGQARSSSRACSTRLSMVVYLLSFLTHFVSRWWLICMLDTRACTRCLGGPERQSTGQECRVTFSITGETHTPSQQPEVLVLTPPLDYPFQQTVVDLFQLDGRMYLAYTDRLTGWFEVAHFPGGNSLSVIISKLRNYFTRWGAPEQISTDSGTNLASEEMSAFFKKWGCYHLPNFNALPTVQWQSRGSREDSVTSDHRQYWCWW